MDYYNEHNKGLQLDFVKHIYIFKLLYLIKIIYLFF